MLKSKRVKGNPVARRIGIVVHTDTIDVKNAIEAHKFKFVLVNNLNQKIPSTKEQKKLRIVLGFTSVTSLVKHLRNCARPPILFDVPTIARHVALNHPVVYLDSDPQPTGIVRIMPLRQEVLIRLIKHSYAYKYKIVIEKGNVSQYGNNSDFSVKLNNFLATIPQYMWEPTIISLVTSLETGFYTSFESYVETNRMVTNENIAQYKDMVEYLTSIKKHIKLYLETKKTPNDKDIRKSLSRIRLLRMYYSGKDLKDYIDGEDNVNLNKKKKG